MSRREVEQPPLDEYPMDRADGKMTILNARTIYRFIRPDGSDGHWLAVLVVEADFGQGPKRSVRIYKWQWRQPRKREEQPDGTVKYIPMGEHRWARPMKHNINKKRVWEDTKAAVDTFVEKWL